MIIGIISDMHLGHRQYGSIDREEEFYGQYLKCMDALSKENIDLLIIGGDLFDKPNPSPRAMRAYEEGLNKLGNIPIVAIKGNHTMLMRDNHYSVDNYFADSAKVNYFLADDESLTNKDLEFNYEVKLDPIIIDGITYRGDSELVTFKEIHKKLAYHTALASNDNYKILVVHQAFKEFCGFTGVELSINDLDLSAYDLIICGHIHSHTAQRFGRTLFIQPGSTERMNTTEARDAQDIGKGYYIVDTEKNQYAFHNLAFDREFLLGDINFASLEEIENHFDELEETVNNSEIAPIISYNYYDNSGNVHHIRDLMRDKTKNALINNSNIYDMAEEEIVLEIQDNEMPTVLDALKQVGLEKNELGLAHDIYQAFKTGNDEAVEGIVDSYFEKHYKDNDDDKDEILYDSDTQEYIEFFENLGRKLNV